MNIRELAEKAGTPVRMVRYLISEGFVDRPTGPTSRTYEPEHLVQVAAYLRMQKEGMTREAIRLQVRRIGDLKRDKATQGVVHVLLPGVELKVVASLVPKDVDVAGLHRRIVAILAGLEDPGRVQPQERTKNADVSNEA